jgi:hypothetical protein
MKKSQLRNIIKEELEGMLSEQQQIFYPGLYYVIGVDPSSQKYTFWPDAFSNKTIKGNRPGHTLGSNRLSIEEVINLMKDKGHYDFEVITGTELAIMIAKDQTTEPSPFKR